MTMTMALNARLDSTPKTGHLLSCNSKKNSSPCDDLNYLHLFMSSLDVVRTMVTKETCYDIL